MHTATNSQNHGKCKNNSILELNIEKEYCYSGVERYSFNRTHEKEVLTEERTNTQSFNKINSFYHQKTALRLKRPTTKMRECICNAQNSPTTRGQMLKEPLVDKGETKAVNRWARRAGQQ